MFKLLKAFNLDKYTPRHYIIAETDKMSIEKTNEFERGSQAHQIHLIKRSRNVGQSYFTSIFTTLAAIFLSISLIYKIKPKVLLTVGPGTCIPLCMVAFILGVSKFKIDFIKSA
jgi:beta-1,4-N-acetylglucosaminyltransferase